jgi:hypothetical protein
MKGRKEHRRRIQRRYAGLARSDAPSREEERGELDPSLHTDLSQVVWPAYYLDFETVMTAVPLHKEVSPYEQIVTQYSIHKCKELGKVTRHLEYLADATRDCRRELAERLIEDLGTEGSIIVYSSFEKTRIRDLARRFPDLAVRLSALEGRLFDIMCVTKKNFYHPEFCGSYSIKKVLPVLAPELSYDELSAADGDTATTRFARMARGEISREEEIEIRTDLLVYCRMDTYALVRLHECLLSIS